MTSRVQSISLEPFSFASTDRNDGMEALIDSQFISSY